MAGNVARNIARHVAGRLQSRVLLLLVVVSSALVWVLLPFSGTILWACIIALLFAPVYRWLLQRVKRRRTPAALLTLLVVLFIVILPLALIVASLAREADQVYQGLQSGVLNPAQYFQATFAALPDGVTALLNHFGVIDFAALQRWIAATLVQGSQIIATQVFNIGQYTFDFVAKVFVALYLAFFLIRDGSDLALTCRRAIPLAPEQIQELLDKLSTVIRATVKGSLLVAMAQGALGGAAFFYLGFSGAMLLAVLMAFASLLPVVGAGLVWLPVAIYLALAGEVWQSVGLAVYGVLVIGLADNVLRPLLVGKDTQMPDYVVMMTTLGGIVVLGINGIVVGPAIAAMFLAVWHIYFTPPVSARQAN